MNEFNSHNQDTIDEFNIIIIISLTSIFSKINQG